MEESPTLSSKPRHQLSYRGHLSGRRGSEYLDVTRRVARWSLSGARKASPILGTEMAKDADCKRSSLDEINRPEPQEDEEGKDCENKKLSSEECRRKLVELFTCYAPERVRTVDDLLDEHRTRESELLESVRAQLENQGDVTECKNIANNGVKQYANFNTSFLQPPFKRKEQLESISKRMAAFKSKMPSIPKLERSSTSLSSRLKQRLRKSSSNQETHSDSELNLKLDSMSFKYYKKAPLISDLDDPDFFRKRATSIGKSSSNQRPASAGIIRDTQNESRKHHMNSNDAILEAINLDTGETVVLEEVNDRVLRNRSGIAFKSRNTRQKLVAFFEQHDPKEVENVDCMLRYGGLTEKELWSHLQVKYGINQRGRLAELLKTYEPQLLQHLDFLLTEYKGQEEDVIYFYKMKYAKKGDSLIKLEPNDSTWKPGQPNNYQLLPSQDLGD